MRPASCSLKLSRAIAAFSVAAVSKTEAATFLGPAGVALGLADAVEAPDEALRALFANLE